MLVGYMRVSARLGARQPDRRLRLGRPTQHVGKHRRIVPTPHTSGGACHSRVMFSVCLLMRTRRGVSLVQANMTLFESRWRTHFWTAG
jgi:hypothetical protein